MEEWNYSNTPIPRNLSMSQVARDTKKKFIWNFKKKPFRSIAGIFWRVRCYNSKQGSNQYSTGNFEGDNWWSTIKVYEENNRRNIDNLKEKKTITNQDKI